MKLRFLFGVFLLMCVTSVMSAVNALQPAFKENNVAVVLASDDNYAMYLGVALKSIVDNSSDKNNYDIVILENGISKENKKLITGIAKKKNFSVRFFDASPFLNKHKEVLTVNRYITVAAYNRIFIPEIMASYSKVVYLDCNIIVNTDIANLYNTDLKGKIIAAVRDPAIYNWSISSKFIDGKFTWGKYCSEILQMDSCCNYFNSGVLIFNIERMTKEGFVDKCIKRQRLILDKVKCPDFHDQDLLNSVCYNDVLILSNRWNPIGPKSACNDVMPDYYSTISEPGNCPHLIHWPGPKPWQDLKIYRAELFWQYAKKTPFYEKIIEKNGLNKTEVEDLIDPR